MTPHHARTAPLQFTNVESEELRTRGRTNQADVFEQDKIIELFNDHTFRASVLGHYYRAYNAPETVIQNLFPQLLKLIRWVPGLSPSELAADLEGMPPSGVVDELGLSSPGELDLDLMKYWFKTYPHESPGSLASRSEAASMLSGSSLSDF